MSFGYDLRLQRERLGASLEQVAAETKVSVQQLLALERDDTRALPGGVFHRGMVQSYCRALGLDEDLWLARLQREFGDREENWTEFAEAVKRNRVSAPAPSGKRWIGVLLMVAALLGVAWAVWKFVVRPRMEHTENQRPPAILRTEPSATIDSL